jgi:hypothetical protein
MRRVALMDGSFQVLPLSERAVMYAEKGWHVLPVRAGTKGRYKDGTSAHYLPRGHRDASCDPATVRQWWTRWPDANIGLNLAASGLVALDPDTYKPDCGWQGFIADKTVPETLRQKSASGGEHYVFTAEDGAKFPGQLCKNVDIKHEGYIMVEPSTFGGVRYEWQTDIAPAACPPWVPRVKGKLPDTERKAREAAMPGAVGLERLRWALSWFDPDAAGYDKWKERLMAVHAETGGSDAGLALVEEWSQQGEKYKPGEITRKWRGFKLGGGITLDAIMRDLPLVAQLGAGPGEYMPRGMTRTLVQVVHRTAPAFAFTAVGDLEVRPSEFLIDGLIETDSLGLIFGDPGCGKSFIAADIALSVATGDPFHGRPTKQGAVFFIAGEGHSGLARRFQAWAKHRGRGLTGVPMFKSNRAAQFLDAASAQAVADAVDALVSAHGVPHMIIVDTLARNFGPGDENSTSEMGAFVAAMDDLRGRHPGCVVLIVHHSGHGDKQRARGAMALKGAIDFEYRAEKSDDTITLTNTKMKDATGPDPLAFRLQGVPLADGAYSAAMVPTVAPEGRGKLKPNEKVAMKAFKAAADEQDGSGNGLHLIQWSDAFLKIHTGTNPDSKRRMFGKARADLVEKGIVSVEHDIYKINGSLPLNSDGLPDFSGFVRTNPAVQGGLSGLLPIGESGIRHSGPHMPGIN